MSNYSENKKAIDEFRTELRSMLGDISEIDKKVINKAVNEGIKVAKANTPVDTGFMYKQWKRTPTKKSRAGVEKTMFNAADYSSYVNDGHRVVNGEGETVDFIKGKFMLEKAISKTEKVMIEEFRKEVERVNRKHDKRY